MKRYSETYIIPGYPTMQLHDHPAEWLLEMGTKQNWCIDYTVFLNLEWSKVKNTVSIQSKAVRDVRTNEVTKTNISSYDSESNNIDIKKQKSIFLKN
jgi:hypothetical protein